MSRVASGGFVGRAEELGTLEEALGAAAAGGGSTILVAGEAGIGKTRLVAELAERAHERGATVLSGRCIDLVGTGLPYLPFVEALRPVRGSPFELQELPLLVEELGGTETTPPDDRAHSQLRLFEEVLSVLERLSADAPVVLVLEDLHWADDSTLDLTAYLAQALHGRPVLLVVTYRSDETAAESPVRRFATELRRAGTTVLELIPLDRDDLDLLLAGRTSADLAETIYARSEGNPFFAEELIAAAARDEELLPRVLRDVLLRRVAGLDATARSVLRAAAAAGRDVRYGLLAAVVSLAEHELVEALRRAVEHDVLVSDPAAGTFRFRHALLAEAVYGTLLPGEREELHARLARALTAESGRATEIAHHWAGAGRTEEALAASVQAAREAERVSGFSEALRHLERAVALWPRVPSAVELTGLDLAAVLEWAAELASLAGAASRAAELADRALELVGDEDPLRAAMLYLSLGSYLTSADDVAQALEAKKRAVALVPPEPPSPERARALVGLGRTLTLMWRHADSAPYCEQAVAVARATGARSAELEAMVTLGVDLCYLGRAEEGLELLEAARRIWEEHGGGARELATVDVFGDLSDTLIMLGRLRDGARVALEGLATAARLGVERSLGIVLAANAVEASFGLGDWERAREVADRALQLARGYMRHPILLYGAELELGLGELEQARAHLEEAAEGAEQSRGAHRYFELVAELALLDRRLDDAREVVSRALARIPSEATFALIELCAVGLRVEAEQVEVARIARNAAALEEATTRAQHLLEEARRVTDAAVGITPVAAGWRALAEAEYARVVHEAMPERWADAVETWDELEQPYRAAYSRWRHAEALVRAGAARSDATVPARQAHGVCRRLGARLLQRELELLAERARLDLVGLQADEARLANESALGLTAREAEVIQLLARGYTNREIAAELTISVKTASVHVSHILRKLNVTSRVEAAAIAHRLAPPRSDRSASGGSAA